MFIENYIQASIETKQKILNDKNIGLIGEKECLMDSICDYILKVPSSCTPII